MSITQEQFRAALSRFASGVTVVTTKDAGGSLHGITVSAFCSVSLSPPMVLICIEQSTGSHNAFRESGFFVVNVLGSNQKEISERFASQMTEKFERVELTLNLDGVPVLSGCLATLECRVKHAFEGGDHSIFIGEVEHCQVADGDPLIYFRSDYRAVVELP
ncbi:MAG: flavin reductase family protein [Acidobacteria bacterium]|nr:flavin reductase family protein [Acidobacteriota bacterium]MCA1609112.1 flavin reductase family protein [Acidobacteriota bacterium]